MLEHEDKSRYYTDEGINIKKDYDLISRNKKSSSRFRIGRSSSKIYVNFEKIRECCAYI